MELIVANGTVVTLDGDRRILRGADVVLAEGRIQKIGRAGAARGRRRVLDATGMLVLPGFVQGHLHACQTLFRNRADGLELLDWLRERIWPFEAAHDADSMRISAELTFAELIRSGTTAALDMGSVHHYDQVFEAARHTGFRLTGGKAMMDSGQGVPARLRETTRDSIDESLRLLRTWHGAENGRLRYAFAPRFVLSCTEELLREVAQRSKELDVRVHTHASENQSECDAVRQRVGDDNVAYLHRLGIFGRHVTLAHCIWLTAAEQRLLRETQTVICHCPSSNLKLASGIAKVPELLADGVNVCLGADGAPCNNNLDMFLEMRLAALIHKPRLGPLAMPASTVLELATLGGARALGLEQEIGSLEEGKRGDLICVQLAGVHASPSGDDPIAQLVHSARADDVRHTVIDGQVVMKDRHLLTLDEPRVLEAAARHASRLAALIA